MGCGVRARPRAAHEIDERAGVDVPSPPSPVAASRRLRAAAHLAAVLVATGCGGSDAPAQPVRTVTVTATAPAATTVPSVRAVPSTGSSWTMPDLVGSNLQDAQNGIQDLTDFEIAITTSHDSTGAGRQQVLDRNWKVCSQNVAPGTTITRTTKIDFGAVKLDEACP
jgi:hypothetical protein